MRGGGSATFLLWNLRAVKSPNLKNSCCTLKDTINNCLVGKIRLKEDVWDDQGHLDERESEV
jgi:hypothetical protein